MGEPPDQEHEIYKPLDADRKEIRILHVEPSSNIEDELYCILETVSLADEPQPRYEAISYCWGEVAANEQLRLNSTALVVPASAAKALRQVRLNNDPRALWLDAVCIDQANIREKEQQIPLMRDVHSKCISTLVWLGDEESDDIGLAIRTMEEMTVRADFIGPRALCSL